MTYMAYKFMTYNLLLKNNQRKETWQVMFKSIPIVSVTLFISVSTVRVFE